ncbi:hypothetical protein CBL_20449 [Carabus blaptoides fortunei]
MDEFISAIGKEFGISGRVQSVSNTPLGFSAELQCYITTDLETAGSDFLDADLDLSSKDSERSTEFQSQILYTPTQRKASLQDNPLYINKRQKKRTSDDFSELIAAMKAQISKRLKNLTEEELAKFLEIDRNENDENLLEHDSEDSEEEI